MRCSRLREHGTHKNQSIQGEPLKHFLQESAGVAFLRLRHFLRCARDHQTAAFVSAFRAQVNHVVRSLDDIKVVLNHQNAVPIINQSCQAGQQTIDVSEMQA